MRQAMTVSDRIVYRLIFRNFYISFYAFNQNSWNSVTEYFENMLIVSIRTLNRRKEVRVITVVNGITLKHVLWERLAKFCVPRGGVRSKAIPIRAWAGPFNSRRLRLPEFTANRHTEVTRLPTLRIGRHYPLGDTPGTHFCQGHSAAERIMSMKNPNDPIGIRIRDLPAYSALLQPTEPQFTSVYAVPFWILFYNQSCIPSVIIVGLGTWIRKTDCLSIPTLMSALVR